MGIFRLIRRAAALILMMSVLISAFMMLHTYASYEGIYEKTLRLHVLANSDTKEDQDLKLKVRDAAVSYLQKQLGNAESREEAAETVRAHLAEIEELSENVLLENGSYREVKVVLGKEYYPTRNYEHCAFPAGEYLSLRIFIGSAEGKNWWCVLYPPLCLSSADASDELEGADFSKEEQALILGKYKVRFAFMELFSKCREAWKTLF